MLVLPLEVNLRLSGVEHFLFLDRILKVFYQNSRKNSGKITKKGEMFKMTRKARSHDVLGKLSAFSMAVILLLSVFVPTFASTVEAGAASNSYSGEIYVDFSKNSTWLAYAGTGRVKVNGSPIEKPIEKESGGLYKTKTSGFTGDTITVEYSYSIPNQENRLFYKGSYTYAYFWQDGGASNLNGPWPGMSMQKFDTDKYYCDYNSEADSVIFNDNSNKTDDLTIDKTNNVYDNGWTAYNAADWTKTYTKTITLSSRANNAANTIYMDESGSVQWSRYDHSKSDPYTMTSGENVVEVKLYAPDWGNQAHVMYDLNDPMANAGKNYTGTGTVTVDEKTYNYFVLKVPLNSVFKFYKSSSNSGTNDLTVPSDYANLYYSVEKGAWVEAKGLSSDDKADFVVSDSFPENVIGVDAMYFDYLSNNERSQGWRNGLNDDAASDAKPNPYRQQFSNFNDLIKAQADSDVSWRYPMLFGDDYNSDFYIYNYWNSLQQNADRAIYGETAKQYFYSVNSSGGLGGGWNQDGTRDRSVQGLVSSSLNSGNLTVGSNGTLAPYFNYDLLHNNAGGAGSTGGTGGGETQKKLIKTEVEGNFIRVSLPKEYFNDSTSVSIKHTSTTITLSAMADTVYQPGGSYTGGDTPSWGASASDDNYYYIVINKYPPSGSLWSEITLTINSKDIVVSKATSYDPETFAEVSSSGSSSGTGAYAKVISAKFPFVATKDASTGVTTYSFNSAGAQDNVYFDWSNGEPTQVNYGAGTSYGVKNRLNGDYGIFPFNNGSSSAQCDGVGGTDANGKMRDYGFGIKMKTYFTLPENGVYGSGSTVTPPSVPDDQVWVQTGIWRFDSWGNSQKNLDDTALAQLATTTYQGTTFYIINKSDINNNTNMGFHSDGENNKWYGNLSYGKAYYKNGTEVGASSSGEHAMFEYSGDDDLWVFIDGQLVLDLGGAHMPTTGSIDFGFEPGKIKATADKVYLQANGGESGTTDTKKDGARDEKVFNFDNKDPSVRHEMVVYYMERGMNDSNLKVEFSIQPVTNDLRIDKTVDVSDVNDGLKDAAKTADNFTFATSQSSTPKAQDTFGNGEGVLYNASDKTLTANESMTIAETYSGNLNYTTTSFVEDINAQQQIESKDNNQKLNFKYINAKGSVDINTSLSAHFTNKTVTQPLTVTKKLVDENDDPITDSNIDFNFIIGVDLAGSNNYTSYPVTYKLYDNNDNDVLNSDGINLYTAETGRFKLKAGYKAKFEGIPEGATYQISEEGLLPGYSFISSTGATKQSGDYCTGTIASSTNAVEVTNRFIPVKSYLAAFKKLDGSPYTGTDFTFTQTLLYCDNNNVPSGDYTTVYSESVSTASSGNVTFKNVTYEYTGKYIYSIRESLSAGVSADKYVMDATSTYYAQVTVGRDTDNNLTVDIDYYKNYDSTSHNVSGKITEAVPTFNNLTATKYTDVSFKKQDENGNALSGAEFTLYTDAACTTKATEDNASKAGLGFTNPVTSAQTTGLVTFTQLKYQPSVSGDVKATYYFKETKAPNGYQLLTGTFKIEIAADGTYKISYDNIELTQNDKRYIVTNLKQPELPIAGGMGVTMFYVLGALAVVIAGTAFVLYKKRINVIALAAQLIHRK